MFGSGCDHTGGSLSQSRSNSFRLNDCDDIFENSSVAANQSLPNSSTGEHDSCYFPLGLWNEVRQQPLRNCGRRKLLALNHFIAAILTRKNHPLKRLAQSPLAKSRRKGCSREWRLLIYGATNHKTILFCHHSFMCLPKPVRSEPLSFFFHCHVFANRLLSNSVDKRVDLFLSGCVIRLIKISASYLDRNPNEYSKASHRESWGLRALLNRLI